jgi:hypothetical protein
VLAHADRTQVEAESDGCDTYQGTQVSVYCTISDYTFIDKSDQSIQNMILTSASGYCMFVYLIKFAARSLFLLSQSREWLHQSPGEGILYRNYADVGANSTALNIAQVCIN